MFLDSKLLLMAYRILTHPFDENNLPDEIKKTASKINHDLNSLLELTYFYEEKRKRLSKELPNLRYKLENDLSLKYIDYNFPKGSLSEHSISVQIERLYDLFSLKDMGDKKLSIGNIPNNYLNVVNFLRLNELFSLCLMGVAKVIFEDDKIIFLPSDSKQKEKLYITWFARNIENHSILSTFREMEYSAKIKNEKFLYKIVFDKIFYLKIDEFSEKLFELESFKIILDILKICMFYLRVNHESKNGFVKLKVLLEKTKEVNINNERLKQIINLQKELLITEQFLLLKDNCLYIDKITFFYGLRRFFKFLGDKFNESEKRDRLIGGKYFENCQIDKIKNSPSLNKRFNLLDGILQHQIFEPEKGNKYDIEYIIHDKELSLYYFIQAKHSIWGERGYLDGVIKNIQVGINVGIEQLRGIKDALEKGKLNSIFKEREVNIKNSVFVLLHNIPQLDFQYTKDGIVLYDWNTFRNLLDNGSCVIFKNDEIETISLNRPLPLNKPSNVVNTLLKEHVVYSQFKDKLDKQSLEVSSFNLDGKNIVIKGLGI